MVLRGLEERAEKINIFHLVFSRGGKKKNFFALVAIQTIRSKTRCFFNGVEGDRDAMELLKAKCAITMPIYVICYSILSLYIVHLEISRFLALLCIRFIFASGNFI